MRRAIHLLTNKDPELRKIRQRGVGSAVIFITGVSKRIMSANQAVLEIITG